MAYAKEQWKMIIPILWLISRNSTFKTLVGQSDLGKVIKGLGNLGKEKFKPWRQCLPIKKTRRYNFSWYIENIMIYEGHKCKNYGEMT